MLLRQVYGIRAGLSVDELFYWLDCESWWLICVIW